MSARMCIYFAQIRDKKFQFFPLRKAKVLEDQEKAKNGGFTVATAKKMAMILQELTEDPSVLVWNHKICVDNVLQKC